MTDMLNQTQTALKLERPAPIEETQRCNGGKAATRVVYLYPKVTHSQAKDLVESAYQYWEGHGRTWSQSTIATNVVTSPANAYPLVTLPVGDDSLTVEYSPVSNIFLVGGTTGCEVVGA